MSNFLRPHGLYSPWNSAGQNTGLGRLSLFQGIFPTQGLNPGLLHCRQILSAGRKPSRKETRLETPGQGCISEPLCVDKLLAQPRPRAQGPPGGCAGVSEEANWDEYVRCQLELDTPQDSQGEAGGRLGKAGPMAVEQTSGELTALRQESQNEGRKEFLLWMKQETSWEHRSKAKCWSRRPRVCVLGPVFCWLTPWQWVSYLLFQYLCFLIYKVETNNSPVLFTL